jgi:hypothetical protein
LLSLRVRTSIISSVVLAIVRVLLINNLPGWHDLLHTTALWCHHLTIL